MILLSLKKQLPIVSLILVSITGWALEIGDPIQLNGEMVLGGDVTGFATIPETNLITYLADEEQDGGLGVYIVDVKGEARFRVNDKLFSSQIDLDSIDATSNGLIASASLFDPGTMQTINFSGPVIGTPLAGITGSIDLAKVERDLLFSKDGKYVVYLYDDNDDNLLNLFSLRLRAGSQPIQLTSDPVANGDIIEFEISPDSKTVVFRGDTESNSLFELFKVPISGGDVVQLNPDYMSSTDVKEFSISQNSQQVLFIADPVTFGLNELFSVSITGKSLPVKLSAIATPSGDVKEFKVSSDSQWAVYRADQEINGTDELYRVPIDGGAEPVKFHQDFSQAQGERVFSFDITRDSQTVVFRGDLETDGVSELYFVPIDSSMPIKLNPDLVNSGNVFGFSLSPDNQTVVYRARQRVEKGIELFSVTLAGSHTSSLLSPAESESTSSIESEFQISSDGSFVVFNVETLNSQDLYVNAISGDQLHELTTGDLGGNESTEYLLSQNGKYVIFMDDPNQHGQIELFAVKIESIEESEDICVPIKTPSGAVAVICL